MPIEIMFPAQMRNFESREELMWVGRDGEREENISSPTQPSPTRVARVHNLIYLISY